MEPIRTVAIVGLGAIGSIFAVKLSQYASDCVRVIVDHERKARYLNEGVRFNGQRYDFTYVTPDQPTNKVDLILVATKAQGLPDAIAALQPFVDENTLIIPLLNGITSPAAIAARYGQEKVLHAYFVGHGSTRIGNEITFDGVGRIIFGAAHNTPQDTRVQRVHRFFTEANIDHETPDDILFGMWCKFVLNVGVNQASAVLRASYGDIQRNAHIHEVVVDLMQEAITVAKAAGIQNTEHILPWCFEFIRNAPPPFKSSMLQDIEAGRKTEVDLFARTICDLGAQYGVDTPYNRLFHKLIRAIEAD